MGKFGVVLLLLLFESGTLMWSQTQPPKESASPHGDFYVGGAYTGSNPASNASAGIGGGADFRVYKWVEIQGDVDAFIAASGVANVTTTIDYLIGPRIAKPPSGARLTPFADFLIGGQSFQNSSKQHSYFYTNGSGFAFAGDGGLDIRLAKTPISSRTGGCYLEPLHNAANNDDKHPLEGRHLSRLPLLRFPRSRCYSNWPGAMLVHAVTERFRSLEESDLYRPKRREYGASTGASVQQAQDSQLQSELATGPH